MVAVYTVENKSVEANWESAVGLDQELGSLPSLGLDQSANWEPAAVGYLTRSLEVDHRGNLTSQPPSDELADEYERPVETLANQ